MRSPMIEAATYIDEADKKRYSDLKSMQSGAGWYVGTEYHNEQGYIEPGSRDTEYFSSKEAAEQYLSLLKMIPSDDVYNYVRMNP